MWPAQWPLSTKMLDESAGSWLPIWLRGNDWLPVAPVNRVHVWLPKARIQLFIACQLVAGSMTCSSQLHYVTTKHPTQTAGKPARLQLCRCTDRIPNCIEHVAPPIQLALDSWEPCIVRAFYHILPTSECICLVKSPTFSTSVESKNQGIGGAAKQQSE